MNAGSADEQQPNEQPADAAPQFRTMHDDVETWTDTCSCEPEPRWQAVAEALDEQTRASLITDAMPDANSSANGSPPSRDACS
jgi:hypothetical protein